MFPRRPRPARSAAVTQRERARARRARMAWPRAPQAKKATRCQKVAARTSRRKGKPPRLRRSHGKAQTRRFACEHAACVGVMMHVTKKKDTGATNAPTNHTRGCASAVYDGITRLALLRGTPAHMQQPRLHPLLCSGGPRTVRSCDPFPLHFLPRPRRCHARKRE